MRITFVLPGYGRKPVGGFRIVYEYANGLTARGHVITVVHAARMRQHPTFQPANLYLRARHLARRVLDWFEGPPKGVPWQWVDPAVRLMYVPTLDEQYIPDSDAIVATAWETAEYVMEYPPAKGEHFYLIQHYETWSGPKDRVDATWQAPFHKIVIAKWLYDLGLDLGATDMLHIPNAIDHSKFRLTRPLEGRPLRVAMLYSDTNWKGSADGLAALELAKRAVPDLRAVLFGIGHPPRGLPGWITYFRNPAQETLVDDVYNGSSIYLCPSWSEGWHLPPAEAMACGCALVSTDIGGVRDYAIDGETALLSPPRNPKALAANLIRVCHDQNLRYRIARAGNTTIRGFTWDRSLTAFDAYLGKYVRL